MATLDLSQARQSTRQQQAPAQRHAVVVLNQALQYTPKI
ncbi:hypothetical protein I546_0875 [Mycobacterium kansasii 732]|nr:hypothetical protein I546_0875 [Mycobacterium kansasii 732]